MILGLEWKDFYEGENKMIFYRFDTFLQNFGLKVVFQRLGQV